MPLDEMTRRNLELVESLRGGADGTAGTLLDVLDRTATPMGARLLRQWLLAPLARKPDIDARLDAVQQLCSAAIARELLRSALAGVRDVERLGRDILEHDQVVALQVEQLTELMGGRLGFSSEPDRGALREFMREFELRAVLERLEEALPEGDAVPGRKVETELKGETMSGVLALVSPEFFDKLIGHAKVEEAYKYFSSTGAQPLREDTRRRFPFAGIVFEEYNATVTLSTGATETLIPAGEGIAFPLGTLDTFVTHGAPANLIETVNTVGLPIYARQIARPDGSAIEVKTEASILPVNKRPRLAVRIFSSN